VDVKGIGCRDVDWAHIVQVGVTCFEHGIKHSGSIKGNEVFLNVESNIASEKFNL
jgi:hypothetical protein